MLTIAQAKRLVQSRLAAMADEAECELLVVESATLERAFGWVFFYQSRLYLETGELTHCLAGNAPLIVNRITGKVSATGTARPIEYYLAEYEASLASSG